MKQYVVTGMSCAACQRPGREGCVKGGGSYLLLCQPSD